MASSDEHPPPPVETETAIDISLPDDNQKPQNEALPKAEKTAEPDTAASKPEPIVTIVESLNGSASEKKIITPPTKAKKKKGSSFFGQKTLFYLLLTLIALLLVYLFFSFSDPPPPKNQQLKKNLSLKENQNQTKTPVQHYCTTDACQAAANSIAASMDFGADPCLDFYNYSCGSWAAVNAQQSTYLVTNDFTILANKVNRQLKELLLESSSSNSTSNSTENSTSSSMPKAVTLAGELYRMCLPWKERSLSPRSNATDYAPLRRELSAIFSVPNWPILGPNPNSSSSSDLNSNFTDETTSGSAEAQQALVKAVMVLFTLDSTPLVDFFIDIDLNNRSSGNGNSTSPPSLFYFTVPSAFKELRPLYADPKTYREALSSRKAAILTGMGKFFHFTVVANNSREEAAKVREVFQKAVFKRTEEVFTLERELVLATSTRDELKSTQESFHRITLGELNKLQQQSTDNSRNLTQEDHHQNLDFDWTLFPELFISQFDLKGMNISEDTVVAVTDITYFTRLPAILARTPLYVLYNYLGTRLVAEYYSPQRRRGSAADWCLSLVTGLLDQAVSRLYIEAEVGLTKAAKTKQQAEEMVTRIRKSFRSILATNTVWFDEETRARALEKEEATRYVTAYDNWFMVDGALDRYYNLENLEKTLNDNENNETGHFLDKVFILKRHRMATFADRKRGFITRSGKFGAATINAFAIPFANQIVLPLAILQPPLFDVGRPAYLNTASIGSVIGHEATHHFDYNGRSFGADGSLMGRGTSWWTSETEAHYEEAAKCFVAQYDAVVDPWTGKRLRGNVTLRENMADHGGLAIAYGAAGFWDDENDKGEKEKEKKEVLTGKLETFTPEQLFFVAYAQTWCAAYRRPEILAYQIDSDTHAPERYRVNLPLASFPPFSAAFHCPAEGARSVMNGAGSRCG